MLTLSNYFYLSLLILTLQYEQKTPKWNEKLPETFDRGEFKPWPGSLCSRVSRTLHSQSASLHLGVSMAIGENLTTKCWWGREGTSWAWQLIG